MENPDKYHFDRDVQRTIEIADFLIDYKQEKQRVS
jgi:hypothetical protein